MRYERFYSTFDKSFENLFNILPIGVTSKYRFIGAFRTLAIISLWRSLDAYQENNYRIADLIKTNKEVKIENKKNIPKYHQKLVC